MSVKYYLSVFPMEALIASQLDPEQFGSYMATGNKKSGPEILIFIALKGEFGSNFDWNYAKKNCVPHSNGDPKNSVYMSVYRALENVPLSQMGRMYLVTRDGRTLGLDTAPYSNPERLREYYIYQELCPISPLVISKLMPLDFSKNITSPELKVSVPTIVFADVRHPRLENPERTGNTGGLFYNNQNHFSDCVSSIMENKEKLNKTFKRTHLESFTYQLVQKGFYAADGKDILYYRMPTVDELKNIDYDWGRSALIL